MVARVWSVDEVTRQLETLGVERGGVLLVHSSWRSVRPVDYGPKGVIQALRDALGEEGTLVMPSMTDDDDHPFDAASTPAGGMGAIADSFWRLPGVLRSDSPHAFAAIGPEAADITADHSADFPHGLESPVGRVYERNGQVLLMGVGHDSNTTIHLAESLAGVRYRRRKHLTVLEDGSATRIEYDEIDHCCERFELVGDWLSAADAQRSGQVGHATAKLMRSADVVEVVVGRLKDDETIFLHEPGHDYQCDEARASIPQIRPA